MDHNDIKAIIDWYCHIRREKNVGQYRIETVCQYLPGCVRYHARLWHGDTLFVYTGGVSSVEHALMFLVALAAGQNKPSEARLLLEPGEVKAIEADPYSGDAWSRLIYGIIQDAKAGGENRVAIIGISALLTSGLE